MSWAIDRSKIFDNHLILNTVKTSLRSDDTIEYAFIDDFCAQETDQDVFNVASEAGENFNFQIQSFSFSGEDVRDDDVFLHCDVSKNF